MTSFDIGKKFWTYEIHRINGMNSVRVFPVIYVEVYDRAFIDGNLRHVNKERLFETMEIAKEKAIKHLVNEAKTLSMLANVLERSDNGIVMLSQKEIDASIKRYEDAVKQHLAAQAGSEIKA